MANDDGGLNADFAAFIKWRDEQRAAQAEADFEVPLFERGSDGTERSATLPYSKAKGLLGKWWPDLFPPEGAGDGNETGAQAGGAASGAGNPVREFFGKRQAGSGGPPARSA
jgi:hypothetical protein